MSTLIKCEELSKKYGKKEALRNINLTIEGGHIYGLLGPNGSGKTTFIKILNGLLTPTEGRITINDMPIGPQTKAIVAYLPDHTYLDMNRKVKDVISFFSDFYADFDQTKAYEMLEKLEIDPEDGDAGMPPMPPMKPQKAVTAKSAHSWAENKRGREGMATPGGGWGKG